MSTCEEIFFDKWKLYLEDNITEAYRISLRSVIKEGLSFIVKDSTNKDVANLVLYESSDCLNNKLLQIGWIWISQELDKSKRNRIQSLLFSKISDFDDYDLLQAGIHSKNIQSMKLFLKKGFKIKCVHISKK